MKEGSWNKAEQDSVHEEEEKKIGARINFKQIHMITKSLTSFDGLHSYAVIFIRSAPLCTNNLLFFLIFKAGLLQNKGFTF